MIYSTMIQKPLYYKVVFSVEPYLSNRIISVFEDVQHLLYISGIKNH